MAVTLVAAVLSLLALASGIAAVGSGAKWQYEPRDILAGKINALLYVWVTLSSVYSLVNTTALLSQVINPGAGLSTGDVTRLALDCVISLLLIAAHGFIYVVMRSGKIPDQVILRSA